jgi:methylglutaconyl-CoA hydratase
MKSMASFTLAQNRKDADQLFEMYWTIRNTPVPVLGRIHGHAFGGGAGLLAVCDITAAEEQTQISFSEVKWGLVPAVISPFVTERVSALKIREWFLTAKIFKAPEALNGGLITSSGNISQVDLYLEETLKLILNSAPEAVRAVKKQQLTYSTIDWKQARARVTKLIAERRVSQEGQAGLKAFLEKRNPQWSDPPYGSPAKI